jgi:uncharacterized membrane protein
LDRTQLESAAETYIHLRGLVLVPVGLLFIVAALGNWAVGPFRHAWVFLAAVLAIGVAALAITRYYHEHYGRVSPSSRDQVRIAIAAVVAPAVMFGLSLLLRSRAEWSLDLPVNAIAVSFALVMLISYAIGVGLAPHHVVIWGALLIVGAAPVWNGEDPSNIGLLLAGVAVMVCGVFDHLQFVRTFGSPTLPTLENSNAGA